MSAVKKYTVVNEGGVRVAKIITMDGSVLTVHENDERFEKIRGAARSSNWDKVHDLFTNETIKQSVAEFADLNTMESIVTPTKQMDMGELNAIVRMASKEADRVKAFMKKLGDNPHEAVRTNLFGFIQYHGIAICDDGDFLVVKSVTEHYRDHATKTFDNSPGSKVIIPWSAVDLDPNTPCSKGLHVAAPHYIRGCWESNSRIVVCKQDPRNVGCVPVGYDKFSKIRGVGYTVLADVTEYFKSDTNCEEIETWLKTVTK